MATKSLANTGDLIFCHAVGSKYGWYLNQIALVTSRKRNPIDLNPANYEFRLYVFSFKDYQTVQSEDFEKGNVEVIAKKDGAKINAGRVAHLSNVKKLKSFAEDR